MPYSSFRPLYLCTFASVRVTRTSKAMQTTAIRTVAKSLPQNEVILLTLLISNRYIPYTDLLKKADIRRVTPLKLDSARQSPSCAAVTRWHTTRCKRPPFSLQKAAFRRPKRGMLPCKVADTAEKQRPACTP